MQPRPSALSDAVATSTSVMTASASMKATGVTVLGTVSTTVTKITAVKSECLQIYIATRTCRYLNCDIVHSRSRLFSALYV